MDEKTARRVSDLLVMQATGALNDCVAAVQDSGVGGGELKAYKQAVGRVLGEIFLATEAPV